ncbi:MAG TPA: ice-binding family protein, partial [Bacteroidia bacterium]|nr:ice-binding family protein [Bacteroidia bacterium]
MKIKSTYKAIAAFAFVSISGIGYSQAPALGDVAEFALFSTNGAITNSGISQVTGDVGTNNGSSTGFGNVNGVMHDQDSASAKCAADLLTAYNTLNKDIPNYSAASPIGNGDTLVAGTYSISGATVLNLNLFLNAKGKSNAVFIFQVQGSFSANAAAKVILLNGALACNVFWKVEGLVSMASGATMRGTIIANNAAINIGTGDTLEGRALSTAGAVTIDGALVYTPIGCNSPTLTGPTAPNLGGAACYGIFSSTG